MSQAPRPPIAHLLALAILAVAVAIGGRLTIEAWGQVPVRPLAGYLAFGVLLHAASRFVPEHGLAVRAAAWLVVAAAPLHLTTLLRAEYLVPVLALALADLAQHRASLGVDTEIPAGTPGKAIAGVAAVAWLAILAYLVPFSKNLGILLRLGAVATIGWLLVTIYALRPAIRAPGPLLAGAGAFAVSFGLLAGPIVPLGPLMTYWAAIVAVSLAVLVAAFAGSAPAVHPARRVHQQTVRPLPDPLLTSLTERLHRAVRDDAELTDLAERIEDAEGEPASDEIAQRVRALRSKGHGTVQARRLALAEVLDVDIEETGGRA